MSAIKSVILTGDFDSEPLTYKVTNSEFSTGVWTICLANVSYFCQDSNFSCISSISCNFSRSVKCARNSTNVVPYDQPLTMILIESGEKNLPQRKNYFISRMFKRFYVFQHQGTQNARARSKIFTFFGF